jgi:hypothetical protein
MKQRVAFVSALGVLMLACQSRDTSSNAAVDPAARNVATLANWTPLRHESPVCPWTSIRLSPEGPQSHAYICEVVSHAWAALSLNDTLFATALRDSVDRPLTAKVDFLRVDAPELPKEKRSIDWVVIFPSNHADSAGISVRVDSATGSTQVYRHVPFVGLQRQRTASAH